MIKIKRLLSGFIDFLFAHAIMNFFYNLIIPSIQKNSIYETLIVFLFNVLGIFLLCVKDMIFAKKTFGKRLFKLEIINSSNNFENNILILFFRNFITLITLPLSIITIFIFNKSIGDFIFKTKVLCYGTNNNNLDSKINKNKIINLIIFVVSLFLLVIVFIFCFLQKININSLFFFTIIIEIMLIALIIKLFKNKSKKKRLLYSISLSIIVVFLGANISDIIQTKNIDFNNVEDSFNYSFPRANIIKKIEFPGCAYIVYEEEGKNFNHYDLVHYIKKNDIWSFVDPEISKQTNQNYYSEVKFAGKSYDVKSLTIYYNKINECGKTLVMLDYNLDLPTEMISDSYNSEFKKISVRKSYLYFTVLDKLIDENYKIKIKGEEYNIDF